LQVHKLILAALLSFSANALCEETFNVPLHFNPSDNGVEVKPLALEYRLTENDELRLGPLSFDSEAVQLELLRQSGSNSDTYLLQFSWAKKFLSSGQIEIRSLKGDKLLFNTTANPGKVQDFVSGTGESKSVITLDQSHLEVPISREELQKWTVGNIFHYCLTKKVEGLTNSFCSRPFILTENDGVYQVKDARNIKKSHLENTDENQGDEKHSSSLNVSYKEDKTSPKTEEIKLPLEFTTAKTFLSDLENDGEKLTLQLENDSSSSVNVDKKSFSQSRTIKKLSEWPAQSPFKICSPHSCSKSLVFSDSARNLLLQSEESKDILLAHLPSEIKINDKPQPRRGQYILTEAEPKIILVASLSNGGEFHVEVALPEFKVDIFDMTQAKEKSEINVSFRGPKPFETSPSSVNHEFVGNNHFEPAWDIKIAQDDLGFYVLGRGQIPLRQNLKLSKPLPTESLRAFLESDAPIGTYRNSVMIRGAVKDKENDKDKDKESLKESEKEKITISSQENSVEQEKSNHFIWNYKSEAKRKLNSSSIVLKTKNQEFKAYHSIYRESPYEVTGRLSGVFSTSSVLLSAELNASAWFEKILGWQNPYLSVQRWGLGAHASQNVTKPQDSNGESISLTKWNVEGKYRLTSGLTNHDPTLGILGSYQSVNYNGFAAKLLGVGMFWLHSVPRPIDSFFNKVSWFRYPKWFEVNGLIYPAAISSGTTLGASFNLNAQLKVFRTENFFYVFSLGLSQFSYTLPDATINISNLSGSAGVGLVF
jgi:hypothetical protein